MQFFARGPNAPSWPSHRRGLVLVSNLLFCPPLLRKWFFLLGSVSTASNDGSSTTPFRASATIPAATALFTWSGDEDEDNSAIWEDVERESFLQDEEEDWSTAGTEVGTGAGTTTRTARKRATKTASKKTAGVVIDDGEEATAPEKEEELPEAAGDDVVGDAAKAIRPDEDKEEGLLPEVEPPDKQEDQDREVDEPSKTASSSSPRDAAAAATSTSSDSDDPEKSVYERGLYPKDPDFTRQVNCDFSRPEWQQYRHVYEVALNREDQHDDDTRSNQEKINELIQSTRILSSVLWARARNVTDILTCNVGIIAGYQRLSHALLIAGLGPKTALYRYRLLQLALIFIFTLRNANKIPKVAGEYWAASEQYIIPNIMAIRRHVEQVELQQRKEREWFTGRTVANTFRDPNMRIAIVSICAYPPTSDIALKDATPVNREVYARKHGYALRLHTEPPLLGGNVQIQHAKLATVNHYIRSGEFDWVVWLDCDSLIMNLDHTIDSIIYRAAGKWSSNNFAGEWKDTWDPNVIEIKVNENEVTAKAIQFGTATGHMEGKTLVMEFENAMEPLEGQLQQTEEGDIIQWSNGAVWHRTRKIEPCLNPADCPELKGLDDSIDLLITEEGWGLSSANWMVRRSHWTINFLDQALDVAHVQIPLFGDQDAIIYLVMNDQTLRGLTDVLADDAEQITSLKESEQLPDPLDSHVRVIPQRELNAYDHLNAYTMDVDGYQFGDLLVTFPQCKDASCNALFHLAAEYAHERDEFAFNPHDWTHVRLFGPRDLVAMWWRRHMEEERRRENENEDEDDNDDENASGNKAEQDDVEEDDNDAASTTSSNPAKISVRGEEQQQEESLLSSVEGLEDDVYEEGNNPADEAEAGVDAETGEDVLDAGQQDLHDDQYDDEPGVEPGVEQPEDPELEGGVDENEHLAEPEIMEEEEHFTGDGEGFEETYDAGGGTVEDE